VGRYLLALNLANLIQDIFRRKPQLQSTV